MAIHGTTAQSQHDEFSFVEVEEMRALVAAPGADGSKVPMPGAVFRPTGVDVRLARVCLEAGGLRIPRDAASSRFQTVPQLSLSSVQTGSRQPERILS